MSLGIDFELIHNGDETKNLVEPHKKAVLLFHGLTGSPFEMKKYGQFLHKLGYDVFCYSLPGHGERLSEINTVTWKDWCNFAQEKYSALRQKYEIFYVSGLCLGAALAVYLGENNEDITGIVALSTTLYLDGTSMPWYQFLMPLGLYTILKYYYTFPEDNCLGIKNENTRNALAKVMSKTVVGMDNYPLTCVYELLKLSKCVRKNISKVVCPILVVHSKYDNLTGLKSAKVVFNGVSSKIKKYIELNDSYHMVLYDNEKAIVMDNVKEFLASLENSQQEKEREIV